VTYLIISDIHGNLEALDATLSAAGPCDRVLVLGDLVGYGADPNAVIERVRALPSCTVIRGNHDKVAAGVDTVEGFNRLARQAIEWTADALTSENRAWLAALPKGPVVVDDQIEICHGTPFDEDVYVFDEMDALRSVDAASRPICLFGHTHVPAMFRLGPPGAGNSPPGRTGRELDTTVPIRGFPFRLELEDRSRYLLNCGAVGQPRDLDARAAFGMFDGEAQCLTFLRTAYDITTAQEKIVQAGLPEVLAQRLAVGR
jgi:diadenosine tetraphosphatase ApaH/serine/threonine PP2A family protein phosphatase